MGWLRQIIHVLSTCASLWPTATRAAFDLGLDDDSDLFNFVTRPELRVPKFKVNKYRPSDITPGYWFVAPYAFIVQEPFAQRFYQPCQIGPAIYDQDGELVWSGACMFRNQNTCDFRAFRANGSDYVSMILTPNPLDRYGHGIIMDSSLEVKSAHAVPEHIQPFNMHEFKVINEGRTALHIVQKVGISDVSKVADASTGSGLALNMAIRETDLWTGDEVFQFWMHDGVEYSESNIPSEPKLRGPFPDGWDWIHLNAVDKNEDGDYLVTARYTDAIYKVSSRDKKILWRLGGQKSDFELDGFQVSGPHDARFMGSDGDTEYISFLDNGGDEQRVLGEISTAYYLKLDKSVEPWKASIVHAWERPDGGRSDKRGNMQMLANGNVFVGWSENAYISEHSPDGRVLYEARFASKRFVSYRSYLFNFTSTPTDRPVLKAFAYGVSPAESVSVYYVSWNGATEVAAWRFYNAAGDELLGEKVKTGFETVFHQTYTFASSVFVEAVMRDGTVVKWADRHSVEVELPEVWNEDSRNKPEPAKPADPIDGRDEL